MHCYWIDVAVRVARMTWATLSISGNWCRGASHLLKFSVSFISLILLQQGKQYNYRVLKFELYFAQSGRMSRLSFILSLFINYLTLMSDTWEYIFFPSPFLVTWRTPLNVPMRNAYLVGGECRCYVCVGCDCCAPFLRWARINRLTFFAIFVLFLLFFSLLGYLLFFISQKSFLANAVEGWSQLNTISHVL